MSPRQVLSRSAGRPATGWRRRPSDLRGELLAASLADDAEIDTHLAAIHAGELDLTLAPLMSTWGRRSAQHPPALG
jgi:hypothetical protein